MGVVTGGRLVCLLLAVGYQSDRSNRSAPDVATAAPPPLFLRRCQVDFEPVAPADVADPSVDPPTNQTSKQPEINRLND